MKIKNNIKQRYKSIQGLRSFKNTLPTKARRIIMKKGEIYSKTLDNWKFLVGEELFKVCYPRSFKKNNSKGKCLNIMVKRGNEVDLEYSKKIIIDKINYFFGYDVVQTIRIYTFEKEIKYDVENKIKSVTKSKYEKKISEINNISIKNSLIKLNKVFKQK
tara:strand:+ start:591 stop:1070 length:480 start_codon:yes stop_codon:yes gene_type:complete